MRHRQIVVRAARPGGEFLRLEHGSSEQAVSSVSSCAPGVHRATAKYVI